MTEMLTKIDGPLYSHHKFVNKENFCVKLFDRAPSKFPELVILAGVLLK